MSATDVGAVNAPTIQRSYSCKRSRQSVSNLRLEPVEGARTLPRTPREAHAMKTTSGWSAKLTRSIVLKDGTRLVTLGDVRAFILKQPEHIQERGSWQHAAELMILAAERGGSIEINLHVMLPAIY